jgi:CSLREA domain-containing protein
MEGNTMKHSKLPLVVIALIFITAQSGLAMASPEAPRATIIVDTYVDELDGDPTDDTCSLREALQSAGNNMAVGGCAAGAPGADTITLSSGIYYMDLEGSDDANQVGDFDIGSEITINGTGTSATIIEGRNASEVSIDDRVFHLPNSSGRLILNDLTVQYGNSMEHGGAIYSEGGYVRLDNVALLHNYAPGYGGAYATPPSSGGAPKLAPDALLSGGPVLDCMVCYFLYNTAGWDGGAIFSYRGILMMDDAYFEDNTADAGGALLLDSGQSTSFAYSTFINNTATDYFGGAMVLNQAVNPVSIESSVFTGNTAGNGGGAIYGQYGTINIADSAFRLNEATQGGGGIFITSDAGLNLDQVEITHNTSGDVGGGILLYGNLNATNLTLALNSSAQRGAGLFSGGDETTVSLAFSTIAFNTDEDLVNDGDGIWTEIDGVSLEASIIAYNGAASVDGHNCDTTSGYFSTQGYNIETGNTCGLDDTEDDLIHTNPHLGSLANHASINETQVFNLLFNNPAIDFYAGYECPVLDGRGFSRPRDGGSGSAECDSGAYEADQPVLFLPLIKRH